MAFFLYKDIKKNRYKIGVFLRVRCMLEDKDFCRAVKESGAKAHNIEWIKITEVKNGWVRLQCWTRSWWRRITTARRIRKWKDKEKLGKPYGGDCYLVASVIAPENPEWVCESDMGRGLKE